MKQFLAEPNLDNTSLISSLDALLSGYRDSLASHLDLWRVRTAKDLTSLFWAGLGVMTAFAFFIIGWLGFIAWFTNWLVFKLAPQIQPPITILMVAGFHILASFVMLSLAVKPKVKATKSPEIEVRDVLALNSRPPMPEATTEATAVAVVQAQETHLETVKENFKEALETTAQETKDALSLKKVYKSNPVKFLAAAFALGAAFSPSKRP